MGYVLAATNTKALWYLTRGTGLVALVLLTGSVLLGILEVGGWARPTWPRFVTAGLHRNVSLLATAFVVVHIATAVLDSYAPIGWLDAVLPFHSPYRPLWLGLGAVAFDLLLAVIITSLVRRRLGYPAWKAVHWASYACWPIALIHGLGTGTDTSTSWVLAISLGCLGAVVAAVWWRLWQSRLGAAARPAGSAPSAAAASASGAPVRAAALVASVLVPVFVVAWLLAGPLKPGWAVRAGTPKSDITTTATSSTGG
ncbi:MAG TPA: ferric reductase-like transmembrane domain-containing protein [Acidimicrobiales bacterium]|jgi:DMSO/TMAO reductase YedYZ heme-binding membrane subunit|nr:ferric reductase-like transmembrane domain-containing protein [Acidimicrobiales bacterium]